jgi:hypothetical protein
MVFKALMLNILGALLSGALSEATHPTLDRLMLDYAGCLSGMLF